MIIPLDFKEVFTVWSFVRVSHFHNCFGKVKFIIDTGSSRSLISQEDAEHLRIPIRRLVPDREHFGRGLSGGFIELYKLPEITISFLDPKNDKVQKIKCRKFDVGVSANKKTGMEIKDSILGNDFLIEFKLKLIANPHGESYLESV